MSGLLTRRVAVTLAVPLSLGVLVTAGAPGLISIRVRPGDTLSGIAQRQRTSVARLVALNRLPGNGDLIYAGQRLRVPAARTHAPAPARRTVDVHYVVRRGDTLSGIAARYGASQRSIARRNDLPRSLVVMIGQRLHIPRTLRSVPPGTVARPTLRGAAARHARLLAARPVPSRHHVRADIAATARRYGVQPALALGIAWQESGFNQRMVSPADAIGTMQVLPSTGRWVSTYVVGRRLDLLDAHDNITAGVALLRSLLRSTGMRVRTTVAAYYQGLASVRSRGMYGETRRYVANVLALRRSFG